MKRWINVIVLLMLIGIAGAGLRYWTTTMAIDNEPLGGSVLNGALISPLGVEEGGGTGASEEVPSTKLLTATQETLPVTTALAVTQPVSTAVDALSTTHRTTVTGQLIMIDQSLYPYHKLVRFDLATAETTTLFDAPQDSWIYQIDVAPDGKQLAMAYAAPPDARASDSQVTGRQPYDRGGIYLLALDEPAALPVFLLGADEAGAYAFNPIWSADGSSIYYVSYRRLPTADADTQAQEQQQTATLDVALYQYDIASAVKTLIAQDGVWPRLSLDGERLVYIQVDPITKERGINMLNVNEGKITELVAINQFFDVDTPFFSPDGAWLYFSAIPHSTKVSRTWWEQLLDIKVAYAHTDHNAPANWWRIAINHQEAMDTSQAEQITARPRLISYGEFDDSGQQLFFATDTGIYRMDATGAMIDRLPLPSVYHFFVWIP